MGQGRNTRNGFVYQVPQVARGRGYRLKLVNFGCGGATTTSLVSVKGCAPQALGPGGRAYPDTWRDRASDVRGRALSCGHFPAEEAPEETADELVAFLT